MKKPFLFWLLIQVFFLQNYAQPFLQFETYNTDQGISDNTIFAINQDRYGYIWIGTSDGLNRFDGKFFQVFKMSRPVPGALQNNTISVLFSDSRGVLWIGTRGGGLYRYNSENENFTFVDLSLKLNVIRTMMEDHSGKIWIGTNEGLIRFNTEDNTRYLFSNNPKDPNSISDNYINSIAEDSAGILWIGTSTQGLVKMDPVHRQFTNFNKTNSLLPDNEINAVSLLGNDLWLGTEEHGLIRFIIRENRFIQVPYLIEEFKSGALAQKRVKTIQKADNMHLWIGTLGGGLSLFNIHTQVFTHYRHLETDYNTLSKNSVMSVFKDRQNNLWVGTIGGGLNFSDNSRKKIEIIRANALNPNSLSKSSVLSILPDGQDIWIGTDEGGINVMNRKTGKFTVFMHDPNKPASPGHHVVSALRRDHKGNIWVGYMDNGIDRWNPADRTFIHYRHKPADSNSLSNNSVFSIYEDREGLLWIGTNGGGLNQFNPEKNRIVNFMKEETDSNSLSNNYVTDILQDGNGTIWVGTYEGLNRFIDGNRTFIRYLHDPAKPNSISSNEITCIVETNSRDLWIGTYGGLNRFNPETGNFKVYTTRNGLPSNVICGITEDNHGNLWISTYYGIAVLNPKKETIKLYDKSDGLQGNQFNPRAFAKMASGEIIFGGINGLNIFYPDSIHDNPYLPAIYLTGLKILNKPVLIGDKSPLQKSLLETSSVILNYRQNALTFEFAALNFSSSAKCRYKYFLKGFDKTWIDNEERRSASYTNLPPGDYVFSVQASNNDGIWNTEGTSLKILIKPPFWQTLWFRFLVISFVLGSALTLHAIRVSSIKSQNIILETKVRQRTDEVVQQKEQIQEQATYLQNANTEIIRKNIHLEFQKEEIERQAGEIRRMNYLLQRKNEDLTQNMQELSIARVMQKRVTYEEFRAIYPDDESCLALLRELKAPLPFICKNCHDTSYTVLMGIFLRRCKECGYREPLTSNTIFYRIKFPITKAFYILYLVSSGRNLTIEELSHLISLRKETCWIFRNKVKEVMQQRKKYLHSAEGWKELILIDPKPKKGT
jgi:ligand-binding sensor domain-containing protein